MALNLDKLREKYNKKSSTNMILEKWSPKEGENKIRILPHMSAYFTGEVDEFVYSYLIHYNVGSEGKTCICPKTQNPGAKCPICEASSALYKSGNDNDKELASDLYHKKRFLCNVVDMSDPSKGVQIFEFGKKVYDKLMRFVTSGLFGDILDPEKGRDVVLIKTVPDGKANLTDYDLIISPSVTNIVSMLPPTYRQDIDNLGKSIPQAKSYEELKAILEGDEIPVQQTNVEEVATVSAPTSAPKSSASKVELEGKRQGCFGVDYSSKSAKCRACADFDSCKIAFIRSIEEG